MNSFWWSEEAVQMLVERYNVDGPMKLAKELGTTQASVIAKAGRLGIRPKHNKFFLWTDGMLATLRILYPTEGVDALADKLNVPRYVIQRKVRSLGLSCSTGRLRSAASKARNCRSCDIHFFDEWSSEMAYIFGFLMADGGLTKRLCDVVIGISVKDEPILRYIKRKLRSTRVVTYRKAYTDKQGYRHSKSAWFCLCSTILVKRLIELGLKPRKTYNDDPFPNVPDSMLPHFIRGCFDGDGTAFISSQGYCNIGFVGSVKFIMGIRDALVRQVQMTKMPVKIEQKKIAVCGRVLWGGAADLRKFRDYIYPEGYEFCLERKKKVLDDWLSVPRAVSPREPKSLGL